MILVKEEFLTSAKTLRAIRLGGHQVITMWLTLKGYAASHPTDGYIPDEDIDSLPGAPKQPRKALKALVECGRLERDGSRGPGLVDPAEDGWQLHDYLDHATSATDEELRREKARVKKRQQRDNKRRELEDLKRLSQGQQGDMSRGHRGDSRVTCPGDTGGDGPPNVPRAGAGPGGRGGTRTNPTQPNPTGSKAVDADPEPVRLSGALRPVTAAAAAPHNRDQALQLDVGMRCYFVQRDEHSATWLDPHTWPELLQVRDALAEAEGTDRVPLGKYHRDAAVRVLVSVFAANPEDPTVPPLTPEQVCSVARSIVHTEWWRERSRGLSSLSPEVCRRELKRTGGGGATERINRALKAGGFNAP